MFCYATRLARRSHSLTCQMKKRNSTMTNQTDKQWQPAVEELEQRIAPGTLTVTTPSGMTSSFTLNSRLTGKLTIAQSHTNGVITWTPSP